MKNELDVETARKIRRNKQDYRMLAVYQAGLVVSSLGAMFIKDHTYPTDVNSGRLLLTTTIVTAFMSALSGCEALKVDAETRKILENLQKGK